MGETEAKSALILTEEEWSLLSCICDQWLHWSLHPFKTGEREAVRLAERIRDAAGGEVRHGDHR